MIFSRDRVLGKLHDRVSRREEDVVFTASAHPNMILIGTNALTPSVAREVLSTPGVFAFVGGGALALDHFVRLLPAGLERPAFEAGPEFGADLLEVFRGRTWGRSQKRAGLAVGVLLVFYVIVLEWCC
jgi:hypothetical protein